MDLLHRLGISVRVAHKNERAPRKSLHLPYVEAATDRILPRGVDVGYDWLQPVPLDRAGFIDQWCCFVVLH